MPQLKISMETLAETVNNLNRHDKETLLVLLSGISGNLIKRKNEIEKKKVKPISRAEIFSV